MHEGIRNQCLFLSIALFAIALFLPAADIEGVRSGFEAWVVGYFCVGIFFVPSHLFLLGAWIDEPRPRQPSRSREVWRLCSLRAFIVASVRCIVPIRLGLARLGPHPGSVRPIAGVARRPS
jgi:hypothetical protein